MKLILTTCIALALTGCASHKEYYDAIKEIAKTEGIKATGPSNALIEAAKHSDPQVATAAAVGAGISEALRNAGNGGQQQSAIALIQAPPTALDYVKTFGGLLLGGAEVWQRSDATRQGTKLGLAGIAATLEGKRIESDERRDIMGTVTGNMRAQTEAATKHPTNVTNVTTSGTGNNVGVNGSVATRTDTRQSIKCPQTQTATTGQSGQGGTGGPGGTGTTGTQNGAPGAPSGATGQAAPSQQTECKIEK